jgi:hydrogenase maturation protease
MADRAAKLVVGIGNILQRDDGVGVRVLEVLASLPMPDEVELYEAGTAAIELASVIEGRELLVVLDAIDAGQQPGAVFRFEPDQLRPLIRSAVSLHDVHFLDALDEARLLGRAPKRVVVFAVQVADVSVGIGLTPSVEAVVLPVARLAAQELGLEPEQLGPLRAVDPAGGALDSIVTQSVSKKSGTD